MSENTTKTPKVYVPGTQVKEFKFQDGSSVIRFSINLSKFAPFVKENKNENGYINFNIFPRKEIGTYGDTHSVSLDTWKPKEKSEDSTKPTKLVEKNAVAKKSTAPATVENDEEFI